MRGASRTHQAGLRLGLGSFTGREPGSAITRLRRSIVNRIIANPVRGKTPIWGEEPSRLWPRYIKALGLISAVSLVSFAAPTTYPYQPRDALPSGGSDCGSSLGARPGSLFRARRRGRLQLLPHP